MQSALAGNFENFYNNIICDSQKREWQLLFKEYNEGSKKWFGKIPVIVSLLQSLLHYWRPSIQKNEQSFRCTRLSNKPKLQPLRAGFCQRQNCKRKLSFSDATSTVSFFCNRRQKLVLRRCSAPNSPTET